jgi:hypothetical protein
MPVLRISSVKLMVGGEGWPSIFRVDAWARHSTC